MFKIIALAIMMATAPKVADVVETYDNTMIVETADGNEWEYTFDEMTEKEMLAEKVLLVNDNIIVIK